ncbi:universal stress protein [Planctomycetota bacterium]|nr:universal stress protein [Planctomycetota bacterium]
MKSRFERIVVPTDFSDTAATAHQLAADIGGFYKSKLDLVNVIDATVYAYAGYPLATLSNDLMTGGEDAINGVSLPDSARDLEISRLVLSGTPDKEIAEHAKRVNADVIIIGTHGHGAIARFFLGSVADKVIHAATCPVIVTKMPRGEIKHPVKKEKPINKVLFPTDFSDTATAALDRAIALTEDFDAELYVLHVVDDSLISTRVDSERKIILKELRNHALAEMKSKLPDHLIENFDTIAAVTKGNPAEEIAAFAESHHIDMVVMGSHGRTGFDRALMGSVASKVVRLTHCPVFLETQPAKAE